MGQWTTPQVKKFVATAPLSQFASMLTTHFYVMKSTTPNATTASFLSETGVRWPKAAICSSSGIFGFYQLPIHPAWARSTLDPCPVPVCIPESLPACLPALPCLRLCLSYSAQPICLLLTRHPVCDLRVQVNNAVKWVSHWVGWAKTYGVQFRMEETNTLSLSGLVGASDTLGAALYYIDYSLTMMQVCGEWGGGGRGGE